MRQTFVAYSGVSRMPAFAILGITACPFLKILLLAWRQILTPRSTVYAIQLFIRHPKPFEASKKRRSSGHRKEVLQLASCQGREGCLVSLAKDGEMRLWDVQQEVCVASAPTDASCIVSVFFILNLGLCWIVLWPSKRLNLALLSLQVIF